MKRLVIIALALLCCVGSFCQKLKLVSTSPADNEVLSTIQNVTINFDLSDVISANPTCTDESKWKIGASWTSGSGREAKVYKGTDITVDPFVTKAVKISEKTKGNTFSFSFDSPIELDEGETYTLWMSGSIYAFYGNTQKQNSKYGEDIIVHIIGAQASSLALEDYTSNEVGLPSLGIFTLKFNNTVKIQDEAYAVLYDGNEQYATSSKIEINTENPSSINVDFDNIPLYNAHSYTFVLPEGCISSEDGSLKNNLISLSGYKGTSIKYDCTLSSVSPSQESTIKYLKDVDMKISTPSGYAIGATTKGSMRLYKGDEEEPIGTYSASINTSGNGLVAHINNYELEPATTYKVVLPQGVVVPRKSGVNNNTGDLLDTTNPEITVTYTTPADLEAVPRTEGLTASATADSKITVLVPSFTFEGTTTFVRPNSGNSSVEDIEDETEKKTRTFVTVPIYEVVNGEDVDKGTVKLEYNPAPDGAGDNVTGLEGTPDFSLYEGHTYKIVIPEGALYPYTYEGEYKNSAFWNLETPLTIAGKKAETVSLAVTVAGATVATPAAKNETATLTLTPDEGWTVKALTYNGVDALADYADGKYTTPELTADAAVAVELEYTGYLYEESSETTGIITAGDTGLKAEIGKGYVKITGVKTGDIVKAYTTGGALIATETVGSGNVAKLTLPTGTYIVKVGQTAFKTIVK